MIKWFAYIVLLLIFAPFLLSAKIKNNHFDVTIDNIGTHVAFVKSLTDTTKSVKKQEPIKEVAKAKKQPKPEKVETAAPGAKQKPKRQRRPDGMERPPEIPRRNGN